MTSEAGFLSLGRRDEFPSRYVRGFKVNGLDVAVVRVEEQFYAFSNACTHEDVDLADTNLDGFRLACTFHGSVFDVTTGEALVGPAYRPLRAYRVKVEGDEVFVSTGQ